MKYSEDTLISIDYLTMEERSNTSGYEKTVDRIIKSNIHDLIEKIPLEELKKIFKSYILDPRKNEQYNLATTERLQKLMHNNNVQVSTSITII